jgi:hypothetical protein
MRPYSLFTDGATRRSLILDFPEFNDASTRIDTRLSVFGIGGASWK